MKTNKYEYLKVIQQNYGGAYGWEDVSVYECDSQGSPIEFETCTSGKRISLLAHDLKEYRTLGYPTRVIFRRVLKGLNNFVQ